MTYQKLLVPVDGTELSQHAIERSVALARQLGAAVAGFVAEPSPPLPSVGRATSVVALETELHEARAADHAAKVLRQFELAAEAAGVAFTGPQAQTDRIDDAIVGAAETLGCDMIVMATHGRGIFGEIMFGSHTRAVMARTRLPLLVLR